MSESILSGRVDWRQFFKEAVLELDPNRFPIKLEAAHKAVAERLKELRQQNGGTPRERMELADAERTLFLLMKQDT
jgi:multidrug resistance efflux pump